MAFVHHHPALTIVLCTIGIFILIGSIVSTASNRMTFWDFITLDWSFDALGDLFGVIVEALQFWE